MQYGDFCFGVKVWTQGKRRNKKMTKIYCRKKEKMHEFYLIIDKEEFYLFSQKYKAGVDHFYKRGVLLNKGIRLSLRSDAGVKKLNN